MKYQRNIKNLLLPFFLHGFLRYDSILTDKSKRGLWVWVFEPISFYFDSFYDLIKRLQSYSCGKTNGVFGNHIALGAGRYKTCMLCHATIDSFKDPIQQENLIGGGKECL